MKNIFLNNGFILVLIIINAVLIFVSGFGLDENTKFLINIIDNSITILFVIEVLIKLRHYRPDIYWQSNWNKFDLILITLSIPSLIVFLFNINTFDLSFLLIFRTLRVFKSFRFFRFIYGIDHILNGLKRALRASIFIIIAFTVFIFIMSILSFYLFRNASPDLFGNPAQSLFTMFTVFTVEGWNEIPEAFNGDTSTLFKTFAYIYFALILLFGGIFGLSLVNSIFVDAMVSDNNEGLEKKVDELNAKIDLLLSNQNK